MPRAKRTRDEEPVSEGASQDPSVDTAQDAPSRPKRARTANATQPSRVQPSRGSKTIPTNLVDAESGPSTTILAPEPTTNRKSKAKAKAPAAPKKKQAPSSKKRAAAPPPPSDTPNDAIDPTLLNAVAGRSTTSRPPVQLPPIPLAPVQETRGAPFRTFCPPEISSRLARVRSQRFHMIDRNRAEGQLSEQFSVLGSTGNVYTVVIDNKPRCNCPDARGGNHCKHIMFVFFKVLQVREASGYWFQKALLTSELQDIFDHAPLAPNSLAHQHVREAFSRATGNASAPAASQPSSSTQTVNPNRRIPGEDDDCPVCYDAMHDAGEANLSFCDTCGNALHKECFQEWQRSATFAHKELTCVWCRAPWAIPRAAPAMGRKVPAALRGVDLGGGVRRTAGGYLNLADVVGQ